MTPLISRSNFEKPYIILLHEEKIPKLFFRAKYNIHIRRKLRTELLT